MEWGFERLGGWRQDIRMEENWNIRKRVGTLGGGRWG